MWRNTVVNHLHCQNPRGPPLPYKLLVVYRPADDNSRRNCGTNQAQSFCLGWRKWGRWIDCYHYPSIHQKMRARIEQSSRSEFIVIFILIFIKWEREVSSHQCWKVKAVIKDDTSIALPHQIELGSWMEMEVKQNEVTKWYVTHLFT